jgi:hypothetical protein
LIARTGLGFVLLALGVLLLSPAAVAVLGRPSALKPAAFKPVFWISLQDLADGRRLTRHIVVPSVDELGGADFGHRYIVIAAASNEVAHCWNDLGISVAVSASGRDLELRPAQGAPYAWSSICAISGVWFTAEPGARLQVVIHSTGKSHSLAGQLMLLPFWQSEAKDRLVGTMIHRSIVKLSRFTTVAALLLIAMGAYVLIRQRLGR